MWCGSWARLVFILLKIHRRLAWALFFYWWCMVKIHHCWFVWFWGSMAPAACFSQFRVLSNFHDYLTLKYYLYFRITLLILSKYYSQQCVSLNFGRCVYYYYPRIFLFSTFDLTNMMLWFHYICIICNVMLFWCYITTLECAYFLK